MEGLFPEIPVNGPQLPDFFQHRLLHLPAKRETGCPQIPDAEGAEQGPGIFQPNLPEIFRQHIGIQFRRMGMHEHHPVAHLAETHALLEKVLVQVGKEILGMANNSR